MGKRANKCEFSPAVRAVIYERDNRRCVLCLGTYGLSVAHMIPRSSGGLGIVQNGALLCQKCHSMMDQGSDTSRKMYLRKAYREYFERLYPGFPDEKRIYHK